MTAHNLVQAVSRNDAQLLEAIRSIVPGDPDLLRWSRTLGDRDLKSAEAAQIQRYLLIAGIPALRTDLENASSVLASRISRVRKLKLIASLISVSTAGALLPSLGLAQTSVNIGLAAVTFTSSLAVVLSDYVAGGGLAKNVNEMYESALDAGVALTKIERRLARLEVDPQQAAALDTLLSEADTLAAEIYTIVKRVVSL